MAPVKAPDPIAFLVDLPGYGYAEVSGSAKYHWQGLLSDYVQTRTQLSGLILMMDARRPFTDLDCQMVEWFLPTGKPVHVLLTKADKLTNSENATALRETRKMLERYAEQLAAPVPLTAQLFSSLSAAASKKPSKSSLAGCRCRKPRQRPRFSNRPNLRARVTRA